MFKEQCTSMFSFIRDYSERNIRLVLWPIHENQLNGGKIIVCMHKLEQKIFHLVFHFLISVTLFIIFLFFYFQLYSYALRTSVCMCVCVYYISA